MYHVYMIKCRAKDGKISLYTGYTNNIRRRFTEHAAGRGARFTRGKKLELVFFQAFITQQAAMQREIEIKRFSKQKKNDLVQDPSINQQVAGFYKRGG